MKAVAVFPGKPDSMHLADLPEPSVEDVPDGRGVLVEVLRVGVDGTDGEINAGEYGASPEGYDFLVTGHESLGRVLEVGLNVRTLRPGDYVTATVRRPGTSIYDRIGTYDMTTDETYYERGINLLHGFLTELRRRSGVHSQDARRPRGDRGADGAGQHYRERREAGVRGTTPSRGLATESRRGGRRRLLRTPGDAGPPAAGPGGNDAGAHRSSHAKQRTRGGAGRATRALISYRSPKPLSSMGRSTLFSRLRGRAA